MNILILGASGLLGHAIFRVLNEDNNLSVYGSIRSSDVNSFFPPECLNRLILCGDLADTRELTALVTKVQPNVVINCVSISKEMMKAGDSWHFIKYYSLLPQKLALICSKHCIRLIQISSDGVFSGESGCYKEDDIPDATDVYGASKLLGELTGKNHVTLRTSIIGHELKSKNSLLEWFLSQENHCKCYTKAIFSGFPTVVLAQIIRDVIIPARNLSGVYHVASKPISKFDLLTLVAKVYGKKIQIIPDDQCSIDRSLSAIKFQKETGYIAPSWLELVETMHSYELSEEF